MIGIRNMSIRRKLVLITAATSALSILFITAGYVLYQSAASRDALVRELATTADMLGTNLTAPLLFDDSAAAQDTLQALRARPEVIATIIRKPTGELFAAYGEKRRGLVRRRPDPLAPEMDLRVDNRHVGSRWLAGASPTAWLSKSCLIVSLVHVRCLTNSYLPYPDHKIS